MSAAPQDAALAARASRKVAWRLIPLLGLLYFFSFLDRVNVGFAALTMNADIGLSAAAYGLGSGIFFVGYVLFEVPSNVLLERFGARRWIARIMISWGLLSAAMMFTQGPVSFAVLRFLLGIAEAGFFPGIIYYLTCWFPARQRARIIALFLVALPLSSVIGAPLSTWLLGFEGMGLRGWQWMFLLEGIPTVLLGFVVLKLLTDRPQDATWLTVAEKDAIIRSLETPDTAQATHSQALRQVLLRPRVWLSGGIYFSVLVGLYGFSFWMPQIIASFGERSLIGIGLLTMIPYGLACIAMVLWGRHSDRLGERKWHVALPPLVAALALLGSAMSASPLVGFIALVVAAMGIYAALPAFWALVTRGLTGVAAAGAIALINSIGNIGGFVGPAAIGAVKEATGGYLGSLMFVALCLALGTVLTLTVFRNERASAPAD